MLCVLSLILSTSMRQVLRAHFTAQSIDSLTWQALQEHRAMLTSCEESGCRHTAPWTVALRLTAHSSLRWSSQYTTHKAVNAENNSSLNASFPPSTRLHSFAWFRLPTPAVTDLTLIDHNGEVIHILNSSTKSPPPCQNAGCVIYDRHKQNNMDLVKPPLKIHSSFNG